jgi:transcriptional regulator with XRE-family HTH domain
MNRTELDYYLHWLIGQAGSQKALAKNLGISAAYLSDVLHFRREPGKKLLDAIGIRAEVTYEYITTPIDDVVRRVRG